MSMTASAESSETPLASPLRHYQLSTTGGGEALLRVIGLIRRRGGEVVSLDFRRGDRHPGCSAPGELPMAQRATPPMLEIAVAIDRRQGATLALRLAGLIDVVAVREY